VVSDVPPLFSNEACHGRGGCRRTRPSRSGVSACEGRAEKPRGPIPADTNKAKKTQAKKAPTKRRCLLGSTSEEADAHMSTGKPKKAQAKKKSEFIGALPRDTPVNNHEKVEDVEGVGNILNCGELPSFSAEPLMVENQVRDCGGNADATDLDVREEASFDTPVPAPMGKAKKAQTKKAPMQRRCIINDTCEEVGAHMVSGVPPVRRRTSGVAAGEETAEKPPGLFPPLKQTQAKKESEFITANHLHVQMVPSESAGALSHGTTATPLSSSRTNPGAPICASSMAESREKFENMECVESTSKCVELGRFSCGLVPTQKKECVEDAKANDPDVRMFTVKNAGDASVDTSAPIPLSSKGNDPGVAVAASSTRFPATTARTACALELNESGSSQSSESSDSSASLSSSESDSDTDFDSTAFTIAPKLGGIEIRTPSKVCAKMLVRSNLRCACHFMYISECPSNNHSI